MDENKMEELPENPLEQQATSPEMKEHIGDDTSKTKQGIAIIKGNKGLFVAILIVIIIAIVGASALIGLSSTNEYQGLIKKLEQETEKIERENTEVADESPVEAISDEQETPEEPLPVATE